MRVPVRPLRRSGGSTAPQRFLGLLGAGLLVGLGLGYVAAAAGQASGYFVIVLCVLPLAPALLLRPRLAAFGAVALLPFQIDVSGGAVGLEVSVTDLLLVAATAGLVLAVSQDPAVRRQLAALRPLAPLFAVYAAAALLVTAVHPDLAALVNVAQRAEIVAVPTVVGALLMDERTLRRSLLALGAASAVLGAAWLLPGGSSGEVLGVQKNPAGQVLVNALLLALLLVPGRWRAGTLALLALVCVYATQSRGSLIGLAAALVVIIALRAREPVQFAVRIVGLALVGYALYAVQPQVVQERLLGTTAEVRNSDDTRRSYTDDAIDIIEAHPWLGVGIGNYEAGSVTDLTYTVDPHDVALLETAEGGVVLAAGFTVLQLGTLAVLVRRRRLTPWVGVALAVQVAVLVHSLFDVYWVRGTPVLGWLLVGVALARAHAAAEATDTGSPVAPAGAPRNGLALRRP